MGAFINTILHTRNGMLLLRRTVQRPAHGEVFEHMLELHREDDRKPEGTVGRQLRCFQYRLLR